MQELIKINKAEDGKQLVSARELHGFLEIGTTFRKWFPRMLEYGFIENTDYSRVSQKCPTLGGVQEKVDYAITTEMAKEISMIQRTDKGKEARLYFIQCEKKLIEISQKALLLESIYNGGQGGVLAAKQLTEIEVREATKELNEKIEQDKPLVEFAEQIVGSSDSIPVGDFAKLIKDENIKLGRNKLFDWLRVRKYLMKDNKPYQNRVDQGLFVLNEYTYHTSYKRNCIGFKTLITGKGQVYLVEKLRKEFGEV